MTIYTCPVCGNDMVEMCYPTYPPQYGVECFHCGFRELTRIDHIVKVEFQSKRVKENIDMIEKFAKGIEEFCGVPCDMCRKYFAMNKFDSCPNVKCNSEEHWKMILERILTNEAD